MKVTVVFDPVEDKEVLEELVKQMNRDIYEEDGDKPLTVEELLKDTALYEHGGKKYTMFRPKGKFKESDWLIKQASKIKAIRGFYRFSKPSGIKAHLLRENELYQWLVSKYKESREKKAEYYHYVDPAVVESIKQHGIMGMGQQLRHGTPEQKKKMEERAQSYQRFLQRGERPTTENLVRAIRRFRKHPRGEDRIYLLQEAIDLKKGNDALKSWMTGKVPVKVDVKAMQKAKQLLSAENLDAPPIDYSKLGDKIVFAKIPHPNILTHSGKIDPRFLKI